MNFEVFIRLLGVSMIPVIFSVGFFLLEKFTKFKKLKYMQKQVIIGVVFGLIAVFSTEFGVPIEGATANARDAAPLCAGLIFGGPAGIIAGTIGGVERFFATYWGKGAYSQIACTVSTILAGFFAAGVRKWMFDNKKPSWGFGLAVGIVMEVLHLTILLITHITNTEGAIAILKILTIPMIAANAFSVMLACLIIQLLDHKKKKSSLRYSKLSSKVQVYLLIVVGLAYIATTSFVFVTQTNSAIINADNLIKESAIDIKESVSSDNYMLELTNQIKDEYVADTNRDLEELAKIREVKEISIMSDAGVIIKSNVNDYIGFNMAAAGEQSIDFHNHIMSAESYVQPFQHQSNDDNLFRKYAGIRLKTGYIQVGIDEDSFKKKMNEKIVEMTTHRHIGKTGYVLIYDSEGKLISNEPNIEGIDLTKKPFDLSTLKEKQSEISYQEKVFDLDSYYRVSEAETYYIVIVMPTSEVFESRDAQLIINSFMEVIAFAALFVLLYFLIKLMVVDNITKINTSLGNIIAGDLDTKVDVRTSEEFVSLSKDINYTVSALKKLISEAEARIDEELAFAKSIQASALPSTWPAFPQIKNFDIYATMNTAKEVGGDFYDLYMIDDNHLAFLIADVSGKGIPAAMFMMESKTMLRNFAQTGESVEKILTRSNENLCQNNAAGMFVTCWMGILDIHTGHVEFANAGHNYPAIYRKGKGWELVSQKKNLVLGGFDGIQYCKQEFDLKPGDRIYLYTDGVTEATRNDGALYSDDRLIKFLNSNKTLKQKELLEQIQVDIDAFVEGADQFDDITMLTVDFLGDPKKD